MRGARCSLALLALLLSVGGCAGKYDPLYTEGDGRRLADGEIRMTTRWVTGTKETPDVRVIRCQGGQIACEYETPRGRWEGPATADEWVVLWRKLEPVAPWAPQKKSVDDDDPSGGPYHVLHLRVGDKWTDFSTQQKNDLVLFTSKETWNRLEYSNAIVDFIAAHATTQVRSGPLPKPADSAPTTPPKKP